jgi:hypothetical protein
MVHIDGIKYSSKDIEDTDLEAVLKFCRRNKIKAAHLFYVDQNGEIANAGAFFRNKENNILKEFLNRNFDYNEEKK